MSIGNVEKKDILNVRGKGSRVDIGRILDDLFLTRTLDKSPEVPGRASGCPASPPTDPDVSNLLIRFLGNQSIGTTLAHNCAARETLSDAVEDPGPWKRIDHVQPFELLP